MSIRKDENPEPGSKENSSSTPDKARPEEDRNGWGVDSPPSSPGIFNNPGVVHRRWSDGPVDFAPFKNPSKDSK